MEITELIYYILGVHFGPTTETECAKCLFLYYSYMCLILIGIFHFLHYWLTCLLDPSEITGYSGYGEHVTLLLLSHDVLLGVCIPNTSPERCHIVMGPLALAKALATQTWRTFPYLVAKIIQGSRGVKKR